MLLAVHGRWSIAVADIMTSRRGVSSSEDAEAPRRRSRPSQTVPALEPKVTSLTHMKSSFPDRALFGKADSRLLLPNRLGSTTIIGTRTLLLPAALAALVMGAPPAAALQKIAQSTDPAELLPDVDPGPVVLDGDFETAQLPNGLDLTVTDPNWTFEPGSGLALNSAAAQALGLDSESGNVTAFALPGGAVTAVNDLPAGSYRVRYLAAGLPSASNDAEIRVEWSDAEEIAIASETVGTLYQNFVTRPFRVEVAQGQTKEIGIRFSNAVDGTVIGFDDLRIERLNEWGDPNSWRPMGVPTAADDALILPNVAISLVGDAQVARLEVRGELVVPDVSGSLAANLIRVLSPAVDNVDDLVPARFELGREDVPFTETFEILLTNAAVPPVGMLEREDRAILVGNGAELDLHGTGNSAWTNLVEDAIPNQSYFYVADATGWAPGDEVVIAGSSKEEAERVNLNEGHCDTTEFFTHQHERVRIGMVTPEPGRYRVEIDENLTAPGPGALANAQTLTGSEPDTTVKTLQNLHVGSAPIERTLVVEESPGDGQQDDLSLTLRLDQRSEAANLNRSIVIRSEEADYTSPCANTSSPFTGSGGHVMILGVGHGFGHGAPETDVAAGVARVSSVEFRGLGRTGVLGRYPFHWHMVRDEGDGQFIRGCSVVDSFHRAITIHGTDETRVESNVAVDTLGHAVFLEDGSEMDNFIVGNLVIGTRRANCLEEGVLQTDFAPSDFQSRSPASYWITNPTNVIEDNVASDTAGTGFWLSFGFEVFGDSAAQDPQSGPDPGQEHNPEVSPRALALGSFARNKAHGCNAGLDYNDGLNAPDGPKASPDTLKLVGNLAWEPPGPGGEAFLDDFTVYGCETAVYSGIAPGFITHRRLVSADNEKNLFLASYDRVLHSWIWANSDTNVIPDNCNDSVEAIRLYDGASTMIDCLFEGFVSADARFFGINSAANRNVNHRLIRCTHRADATGGNVVPWAEFSSFDCLLACDYDPSTSAQSCDSCDTLAFSLPGMLVDFIQLLRTPDAWGIVVHDVDGSVFGPSGKRLVSDAPWMLLGDETIESPLGSIYESQRSYGLLKVYLPRLTIDSMILAPVGSEGPPAQFTLERCEFTRLSNVFPEASYLSAPSILGLDACPGGGAPWGPPVEALPFHQIPIVAGPDVVTFMDFDYVGGTVPTEPGCSDGVSDVRLLLGDLDIDEKVILGIEDISVLKGGIATGAAIEFNGAPLMHVEQSPSILDAIAYVGGMPESSAALVASQDVLVIGVVKEKGQISAEEVVTTDHTDVITVIFN